ncbi:NACHT, LRR and PYD domains-containing protein 3-like [Arapaima gigas]
MNQSYLADTPEKERGKTHTSPVQTTVTATAGSSVVTPQIHHSTVGRDVNTTIVNIYSSPVGGHDQDSSLSSSQQSDLSLCEQLDFLSLSSSHLKSPETDKCSQAQKKHKFNLKKKSLHHRR